MQDFGRMAARYAAACDEARTAQLADVLGVTAMSLYRLGLGWDGAAFTFPMKDATGRLVGIRRRFRDSTKLTVKGGHAGLFLPWDLPDTGTILICEGATDTAAMLDLGFGALGRPSCNGGARLICEVAKGRPVVIVADSDPPGQRGAAALASVLRVYCLSVKIIVPPQPHKDARAWKQAGASAADVQRAIDAAEPVRLKLETNERPWRGRSFTEGLHRGTSEDRT